ncbi:hypothetical protein [Microbispora sp. H10830]|uniref:hypothetical protein n=1 Tax=Microbispora sp. H10830 TaxID=2729109 RepID=UPI0015FEE958|nr:hypothetical protein [Microbispora sp. H10830]
MTDQDATGAHEAASYIRPIYRSSPDGVVRVYAGDLIVSIDGTSHSTQGDLELHLSPRPSFSAHIAGSDPWMMHLWTNNEGPAVELPIDMNLDPPSQSALSPRPSEATSWADEKVTINHLVSGDTSNINRLIFHITGPVTRHPLPRVFTLEGDQDQLAFALPGWTLRMAPVDEELGPQGFSFVIEAVPDSYPVNEERVEQLRRRCYLLLSFISSREIGVGPLVGLDDNGKVVWAEFGAPRLGDGQWRWCPDHLVTEALPSLAQGMCALAANSSLEQVVDRAINLFLAANSRQVLDVRIPVACSGLELLSWAILQHYQWLNKDALDKIPAGAQVGLLLRWASVPVDIPADFSALESRKRALNSAGDWVSTDVIFNIRNSLVHPPKKFSQPEWPTSQELVEAWRLAMEYLELSLLRMLDYQGQYLPRLQVTARWVTDTESVPWARK